MKKRLLMVYAGQSNMMGAGVYPPKSEIHTRDSFEYLHKNIRIIRIHCKSNYIRDILNDSMSKESVVGSLCSVWDIISLQQINERQCTFIVAVEHGSLGLTILSHL